MAPPTGIGRAVRNQLNKHVIIGVVHCHELKFQLIKQVNQTYISPPLL